MPWGPLLQAIPKAFKMELLLKLLGFYDHILKSFLKAHIITFKLEKKL